MQNPYWQPYDWLNMVFVLHMSCTTKLWNLRCAGLIMTTKRVVANGISNYERNIRVEVNGKWISTIVKIPLQARLMKIEVSRLTRNEVILMVIFIKTVTSFWHLRRWDDGERCAGLCQISPLDWMLLDGERCTVPLGMNVALLVWCWWNPKCASLQGFWVQRDSSIHMKWQLAPNSASHHHRCHTWSSQLQVHREVTYHWHP